MTVKTSVSMTDQQDAFIKRMVAEGRFASASAVVQQSLELLRRQTEMDEMEMETLRALLKERSEGPFEDSETARRATQKMIEETRADLGL